MKSEERILLMRLTFRGNPTEQLQKGESRVEEKTSCEPDPWHCVPVTMQVCLEIHPFPISSSVIVPLTILGNTREIHLVVVVVVSCNPSHATVVSPPKCL